MIRSVLAAALLAALPLPLRGQEARPAAPPQQPAQQPKPADKGDKLAEWPKLADADRDRATALLAQFRKEERFHAGARDGLIAIGPAVAPLLFQQISDRGENVNAAIFTVLDAVLNGKHAALLARESKTSRLPLRRYVALRLCKLADPELKPVLEAMAKDKDAEVEFYANVGLLAQGQKEALPVVLARVRTDWNGCRPLLSEVLPPSRSDAAGQWLLDIAAKAQAVEQMNALRLLRYLGTMQHKLAIKGYLAAEDNNVKKEAVNALRVLHGEQAMENMPVFQAIEQAKQWQGK